jgi:hypothetical protein
VSLEWQVRCCCRLRKRPLRSATWAQVEKTCASLLIYLCYQSSSFSKLPQVATVPLGGKQFTDFGVTRRLALGLGSLSTAERTGISSVIQRSCSAFTLVDRFAKLHSDILDLMDTSPTRAEDIYELQTIVTKVRAQIGALHPSDYNEKSWTQHSIQDDLETLLLRLCVKLYLFPLHNQSARDTCLGYSLGTSHSSHVCEDLVGPAQRCINASEQSLRSYLSTYSAEHSGTLTGPSTEGSYAASSHRTTARKPLDIWHLHCEAYTSCSIILAVGWARQRGLTGEREYMHCLDLSIPVDSFAIIKSTAQVLLALPPRSDLWFCGQTLSMVPSPGAESL